MLQSEWNTSRVTALNVKLRNATCSDADCLDQFTTYLPRGQYLPIDGGPLHSILGESINCWQNYTQQDKRGLLVMALDSYTTAIGDARIAPGVWAHPRAAMGATLRPLSTLFAFMAEVVPANQLTDADPPSPPRTPYGTTRDLSSPPHLDLLPIPSLIEFHSSTSTTCLPPPLPPPLALRPDPRLQGRQQPHAQLRPRVGDYAPRWPPAPSVRHRLGRLPHGIPRRSRPLHPPRLVRMEACRRQGRLAVRRHSPPAAAVELHISARLPLLPLLLSLLLPLGVNGGLP